MIAQIDGCSVKLHAVEYRDCSCPPDARCAQCYGRELLTKRGQAGVIGQCWAERVGRRPEYRKIKIVVLDLELSRRAKRAKRAGAAVAVVLLAVGAGAVAYGSVPKTWTDGETLTAADLNANFAALSAALDQHATSMPPCGSARSWSRAASCATVPVGARGARPGVLRAVRADSLAGTSSSGRGEQEW
jgi:hypothetical protein